MSIACYKQHKHSIIKQHAKPDDHKGLMQVLSTLGPLSALWWLVAQDGAGYGLTAVVTLLMSLFLLRAFVLMHDCGHDSLFHASYLNKSFGFVFGILLGIPQYVWAKHHAYHHVTNGNWAKYRGPLEIATVDEYGALTGKQQRQYRRARSLWLAPAGGFLYLIFNPRVTWLKGTAGLLGHLIKQKMAHPSMSIREAAAGFETRYWASSKEHRHMLASNVLLLSAWLLMCWIFGPVLFFAVYLISVSFAGGAGIVLFTVQHNFEHAYASGNEDWDHDTAAIRGTSFLVLPPWLNWFTANSAYHHVHHLSARIPNYCLLRCHAQYEHLFRDVTRVKLSQIPAALKCILWDTQLRRIISIAEYENELVRVP